MVLYTIPITFVKLKPGNNIVKLEGQSRHFRSPLSLTSRFFTYNKPFKLDRSNINLSIAFELFHV